jgi:hypothetical protein
VVNTVVYSDERQGYNNLVNLDHKKYFRVHHSKNKFDRRDSLH